MNLPNISNFAGKCKFLNPRFPDHNDDVVLLGIGGLGEKLVHL